MQIKRRNFIQKSVASAAGLAAGAMFPAGIMGRDLTNAPIEEMTVKPVPRPAPKDSIKFSVIGINHNHINGMVSALIKGGGQLVSVFAKEADLIRGFTRAFPGVKVAASEVEILGDKSIQLVASSIIPNERAPLGIRVMKAGKDYMADKPGITTLEQLVSDVVNRTETAMPQEHCFLATELALNAQKMAHKLNV